MVIFVSFFFTLIMICLDLYSDILISVIAVFLPVVLS